RIISARVGHLGPVRERLGGDGHHHPRVHAPIAGHSADHIPAGLQLRQAILADVAGLRAGGLDPLLRAPAIRILHGPDLYVGYRLAVFVEHFAGDHALRHEFEIDALDALPVGDCHDGTASRELTRTVALPQVSLAFGADAE